VGVRVQGLILLEDQGLGPFRVPGVGVQHWILGVQVQGSLVWGFRVGAGLAVWALRSRVFWGLGGFAVSMIGSMVWWLAGFGAQGSIVVQWLGGFKGLGIRGFASLWFMGLGRGGLGLRLCRG
jgi:hypothetical protein